MQTMSPKGIAFLMAEEAIVLRAYRDSGGVWTIGAGHTAAAGPPKVAEGQRITLDEALAIKRRDLAGFEAEVRAAISVDLQQHQFDALVSFHYNTGAIRKGSVDDKINAGDVAGAMATLRLYRKDRKGHVLEGLVARRARETAMFERGEYFPRAARLYRQGKPGPVEALHWQELLRLAEGAPASAPAPPPPLPQPARRGLWAALFDLLRKIFGG